jgi:hypothetical protein
MSEWTSPFLNPAFIRIYTRSIMDETYNLEVVIRDPVHTYVIKTRLTCPIYKCIWLEHFYRACLTQPDAVTIMESEKFDLTRFVEREPLQTYAYIPKQPIADLISDWALYDETCTVMKDYISTPIHSVCIRPYHIVLFTNHRYEGMMILKRGRHMHRIYHRLSQDPMHVERSKTLEAASDDLLHIFYMNEFPQHLALDTLCMAAQTNDALRTIIRGFSLDIATKLRLYEMFKFEPIDEACAATNAVIMRLIQQVTNMSGATETQIMDFL